MTKRIMVVDDDLATRNLVRLVLERKGYEVIEARDGTSALHALQGLTPDLLVVDVMMPGMDGFELCRHARARAETASVPIIMFSAAETPRMVSASLEAGADGFIGKTSSPIALADQIDKLLSAVGIRVG